MSGWMAAPLSVLIVLAGAVGSFICVGIVLWLFVTVLDALDKRISNLDYYVNILFAIVFLALFCLVCRVVFIWLTGRG